MIEKMKTMVVPTEKDKSKKVVNQRSQCRTTHKRKDC